MNTNYTERLQRDILLDGEKQVPTPQHEGIVYVEERILCAAVWYKELELKRQMPENTYLPVNIKHGIVFCGFRHGECIYSKCAITGLRDAESGENEQGFLTSKNRFVSRVEALQIALQQKQVKDLSDVRGNRLHSEDLY